MSPALLELPLDVEQLGEGALDPSAELATLELAERYLNAESHLHDFVAQAWPVILRRQFYDNWHIKVICDHLEAVVNGEIRRLIINVPPRSTKSTVISVCFPVWAWLKFPHMQFLTGSHNKDLAIRDAVKSRRIMDSLWFRRAWGNRFQLTTDQNQKQRYENDKSGHRVTFGFNSGVTGEGGDILGIDDPHPARSSVTQLDSDWEFYEQELSTRLNNADTGAIVVIMQRLNPRDLTGRLLSAGGFEHLVLPLEYESERSCFTCLGRADMRKVEGEILDPHRWSPETVKDMKEILGTGAAGQLQQRPVPKGGGAIKSAWLKEFDVLPPQSEWKNVVQFWDTAGTVGKQSSRWAGMTIIRTLDLDLWIADVFHKQMFYPEGKRVVGSFYRKHEPHKALVEYKSSGIDLISEKGTAEELRGCNLMPFEPCGDKLSRMDAETGAIEAGRVHIPRRATWRHDFDQAVEGFPSGVNQDLIDVLSMGLYYFRRRRHYRVRAAG